MGQGPVSTSLVKIMSFLGDYVKNLAEKAVDKTVGDNLNTAGMGGTNQTPTPPAVKPVVPSAPVRPPTANPNGTPSERKAYSDWYNALQEYNKKKAIK